MRVSAAFGIALVLLYWMALMDWPYIDDPTNFIIDFHIVYAVVLGYLIATRAGHVWGLNGWTAKLPFFERNPKLKVLVAPGCGIRRKADTESEASRPKTDIIGFNGPRSPSVENLLAPDPS